MSKTGTEPRDRKRAKECPKATTAMRKAEGKIAKAAKATKEAGHGEREQRRAEKARVPIVPVKMGNGKRYIVSSATAPSGTQWVSVRCKSKVVWTPLIPWAGASTEALQMLRAGGIVIIGTAKELREAVGALDRFPPRLLFEHPGWTGPRFGYYDGRLILGAKETAEGVALYRPTPGASHAGTLEGWKTEVAEPAAGQTLPSFALMIGFAAALLPFLDRTGNFGFEFSGAAGAGKTTLQYLLASVAGPVFETGAGTYWHSCNATANGMETMMLDHQYMPFVLDEAANYAASDTGASRGRALGGLVFHLADGRVKARYQDAGQYRTRFIFVISTNQPIMQAVRGEHAARLTAIADRLMTIEVRADRPYKTFDSLPEGCKSGGELAARMVAGMRDNYGVALPAFLRHLVNARIEDEAALRERIAALLRTFRERVTVDENDGSATRVADQFGLVYAAGILAKEWDVLPRTINCMAAARACYRLHREHGRPLERPLDRLRAIRRRHDTIDLDAPEAADLSKKRLVAAGAYLKTNRKTGEVECWLSRRRKALEFPDWNNARHELTALGVLRADKKRQNKKGLLRAGVERQSFYVFVLPAEEA